MEAELSHTSSSFIGDDIFRHSIQWLNYAYFITVKISAKDEIMASQLLKAAREITHQLCNEELKSDSEFDFICSNIQRCSMFIIEAKRNNLINSNDYEVANDMLAEILNPILKERFRVN